MKLRDYPNTIALFIMVIVSFVVIIVGSLLHKNESRTRSSCFAQIEISEGWEQQEITCNYRPDSATHEWRTVKTLDAVNDTNPFHQWRRRRF